VLCFGTDSLFSVYLSVSTALLLISVCTYDFTIGLMSEVFFAWRDLILSLDC